MSQSVLSVLPYLDDQIHVGTDTDTLAQRYRSAQPYHHLVMDNFFSDDLLDGAVSEISALPDEAWVKHEDERLIKYNLRSATELREAGNRLMQLVHSAAFLFMLTEITGIRGLLPDPYLGGSGYHVIPKGGRFDVHLDRNTEFHSGLTRRLAMLIYLNHDWDPKFGGQFEMWDRDAQHCEKVVEPVFNRTLLFEIGPEAFHGVRPVTCPRGQSRKSFAVYYHTVGTEAIVPHNSIFSPKTYASKVTHLQRISREILPPILWRGVNAFRK